MCAHLQKVTFAAGSQLRQIDEGVFQGCDGLKEAVLTNQCQIDYFKRNDLPWNAAVPV